MNLNEIQQKLKAPKSQKNTFGNYMYRSCEDILEAIKPLLGQSILTLTDEVVQVGDRFYVKATATLGNDKGSVSVSAFAREALVKKGMDESQITGAASSYARKYALNGLFCIDDTKDADTHEPEREAGKPPKKEPTKAEEAPTKAAEAKPTKEETYCLTKIKEELCKVAVYQNIFLDIADIKVNKMVLAAGIKRILKGRWPNCQTDVEICLKELKPETYLSKKE